MKRRRCVSSRLGSLLELIDFIDIIVNVKLLPC